MELKQDDIDIQDVTDDKIKKHQDLIRQWNEKLVTVVTLISGVISGVNACINDISIMQSQLGPSDASAKIMGAITMNRLGVFKSNIEAMATKEGIDGYGAKR